MAEFSVYPDAIDGYAQLPLVVDSVTRVDAVTVNRLRCAIINIERELGTIPSGDSDTVAIRLDDLDSQISTLDALVESIISDSFTSLPDPIGIESAVIIENNVGSYEQRVLVSADISDLSFSSSHKDPSRVATTGNITLTSGAPDTVDGILLSAEDRVLVWSQTSLSENGIYTVSVLGTGSNGTWVRADDFDSDDSIEAGTLTYIQEGTIHARSTFTLTTTGTIILDTTNLEFIGSDIIMRSDGAGTDVIGSFGTPTTLSVGNTYVAQSGVTDTRDYDTAVWYATVAAKGTATSITIKVEWLEDGTNLGPQGTESIEVGAATLSVYEASYGIGALSAPFNLPTIPLDVIGPNAKVSIKSDTGTTTTVYVRVWRKA